MIQHEISFNMLLFAEYNSVMSVVLVTLAQLAAWGAIESIFLGAIPVTTRGALESISVIPM